MSKITCNTIEDILPLYVDEVVSDDTKILVSEHIENCAECRQKYERMKKGVSIPIEDNTKPLKQFKRAWQKKKVILVCATAVITIAIAAIVLFSPVIFQRGNPIPYLSAASKLDSDTTYAQVNVKDSASVYISYIGTCDELFDYISANSNFELQEHAGGAYIFSNGTDELIVTSEIYLGKYTVWEVPNETVTNEHSDKTDYPPMVMFGGNLYSATNYDIGNETLDMVGEIESCIDYGIPTEDNQANDNLVGFKIYAASSIPGHIFVMYEGEYSPYKIVEGEK